MTDRNDVVALAMVGRSTVSFDVVKQWITALRHVYWPGPTFVMPEIYAAGAWIGVVPLRNLCTYRALQDQSWGWLLWIDADHKVNHALFDRIREHTQRMILPDMKRPAVIGGPYFGREYPFEVQAFSERVKDGVRYIPPQVLVPLLMGQGVPESGLIRVAGVGTGCMLIRRDILERMAERRGHPMRIWRADSVPVEEQVKLLERGESISGVMTEDILFCLDVTEELGEPVWLDLDPRMETGHMGEEARDRRHYLASHTIPDGVRLDTDAIKRSGYEIVNTERERARRLRRP